MKRPTILLLPLLAIACSGAGPAAPAAASVHDESMSTPAPDVTARSVPPIDADVPAAFRTATFALG